MAKYTSVCDRGLVQPQHSAWGPCAQPCKDHVSVTKSYFKWIQQTSTLKTNCWTMPGIPLPSTGPTLQPAPRRAGQDLQGKTAATSDASKSIRQTEQLWQRVCNKIGWVWCGLFSQALTSCKSMKYGKITRATTNNSHP